ncbi:unnamed protein product, partial [Polarella glacialis]
RLEAVAAVNVAVRALVFGHHRAGVALRRWVSVPCGVFKASRCPSGAHSALPSIFVGTLDSGCLLHLPTAWVLTWQPMPRSRSHGTRLQQAPEPIEAPLPPGVPSR